MLDFISIYWHVIYILFPLTTPRLLLRKKIYENTYRLFRSIILLRVSYCTGGTWILRWLISRAINSRGRIDICNCISYYLQLNPEARIGNSTRCNYDSHNKRTRRTPEVADRYSRISTVLYFMWKTQMKLRTELHIFS